MERRVRCSMRKALMGIGQIKRGFTSLSHTHIVHKFDNLVLVEGKASSRTAILHRPSVLNAINTAMSARLLKLYKSWEENPDIGFVVLKGSGRSFCAGGDIVSLYRFINQGKLEETKDFVRTLYSFIYLLGTYLKPHTASSTGPLLPFSIAIIEYITMFMIFSDYIALPFYVALLNGVTMGGGAGVSIPGTFRVATDRTVFATPETLIGFHPDAGASFFLSHLPGYLGEYLALTGDKLNGAEMIGCGLATHYTLFERLPLIEEQLGKLVTDDPSTIETSLAEFGDVVYPHKNSVVDRIEVVDKCFSHDSVEEIIDSLENEAARTNDDWCVTTLNKLKLASPLGLKVSLRSIREGRFQTLDQCLIREYRMSLQGFSGKISNDFCEGVRARLVDKDSSPKWNPPSLEQVSKDMVDQYLSRLSKSEPELELPTKTREAFA